MACYHPIQAFRGARGKSGKRSVVFNRRDAVHTGTQFNVPCGQCIGCRLEKARQWAMRCLHESSLYDENCFLTLTYDEDHLPQGRSLVKEDFQKFMKRLRKAYPEKRIRFFHCGEYGERLGRPHYHACLFGFDFEDKVIWSIYNKNKLYTSEILHRIWKKGYCVIGEVTFESAAYVARYIMKKITGDEADVHYQGKIPEYTTMSRRPGIGRGWYDEFKDDVKKIDGVIVRGNKMRPPKYYDNVFEEEDPVGFALVKDNRIRNLEYTTTALQRLSGVVPITKDNSTSRLEVKERCKKAKMKNYSRIIEKN